MKQQNKTSPENLLWEASREVLKTELYLGKVLINVTNGIVYLKDNKQIKLNIGKARKCRDFSFSTPKCWRVCTTFESLVIKFGLSNLIKIKF